MSETSVILFDIQQSVFEEIETYQKLTITDSKTEKEVRTARASVKQLRYKIQNRQKDLNKELNERKKEIKTGAESLILKIVPTEDNLDIKIKEVEDAKAKVKAEILLAEQAIIDAQQKAAVEAVALVVAEEEAYLEESKRQHKIELKKLADERAMFEAEQAQIKAERVARAKVIADKILEERRKINAERTAIEAEKTAIAAKEEARQQIIKDEQNAIANAEFERVAAEILRENNEKKAEQKRVADELAKIEAEKIRLADKERQHELAESKSFVIDMANSIMPFEFNIPEDVHADIVIKTIAFEKIINLFIKNQSQLFCDEIRKF